jgi:hypothetical protein
MSRNKELKAAYKQLKFQIGVFQIRNTQNNKLLIDSSVNIAAKWNRHKMQLNFGVHPAKELQADWLALGEGAFAFEVLSELTQKEEEPRDYAREVAELEAMYIAELQPFGDKGYHRS